ncbi:MAG: ribosome maturation factor RimP [Deltaproteobacteria bacterium]
MEERIRALAQPVAESLGLELVDAHFATDSGRKVLRVYIDKPGGVSLDDCAGMSREFSTVLDVNDPIPQRYSLEVSSPGLDRPLKKEADFERFMGRRARIRSREAIEGRRNFNAVIDSVDGANILVTDFDGKKFVLTISNIEKARLEVDLGKE